LKSTEGVAPERQRPEEKKEETTNNTERRLLSNDDKEPKHGSCSPIGAKNAH